jgi:hypothetical protein
MSSNCLDNFPDQYDGDPTAIGQFLSFSGLSQAVICIVRASVIFEIMGQQAYLSV